MLTYLQILNWFRSQEQEEGQTLVEYALILVLIAVVVIGVLTLTGTSIKSIFTAITDSLVVPAP